LISYVTHSLYRCVQHFSARQHVCRARYVLSPVRLSVHPSHGWISQKLVNFGSCIFHRTVSSPL